MGIPNQFKPQTELNRILEIIQAIKEKSLDGDYIYRGESQCYEKVSSTLYRKLEAVGLLHLGVEYIQRSELQHAKEYTDEIEELEILTEIQHFGGKTNLIDFTTDYLIALFFACNGSPFEDGRVILQNKNGIVKDWVKELPSPHSGSRPEAQKSVFIRPPDGFIAPDKKVIIPKSLKRHLLEYLEKEYEIFAQKIYHDLIGFIGGQDIRWGVYGELNKGVAYQKSGDEINNFEEKDKHYQQAIEHFTNALQLMPEFAEAYIDLGFAYFSKGELDIAIDNYNKAIELDSQLARAYNHRGNAYQERNETDRAIKDHNRAIELDPNDAIFYNNRGIAYGGKGEVELAIKDFDKAIDLKPDYDLAYNNRGAVYRKDDEYDKAIDDCDKAIQLNPDYAEPYSNRGSAYRNKGDYDRAIEDYNIAIKLKPSFVEAYYNRGLAYHEKGELDIAIKDYSKAIALNSKLAHPYNNRGNVYLQKGDFDRAIEDYNKVIELDPELGLAYYNRSEAWLHLKEWDKAKVDLTAAKDKGIDIVAAFHNGYRNVAMFERRNIVKLPKDIVAMLTRDPVNSLLTTQRPLTNDSYSTVQTDSAKSTPGQAILPVEIKPRESRVVLELLERFRNTGKPLSEYLNGQSSRGITTGCNEAFIVERTMRDALIAEHPSSADVLKPFVMARDIQRWRVKLTDESRREPQDKWLIFTHRGIDINAYPAIKKHLEKYRDTLKNRSGKQEWYELQTAPTDTDRFTQPKCIYPEMASETAFAFDDEGYYVGSPAFLLPTSELWLLGVLNTRAVSWFYARTAPQVRGPFLKFVPRYVSQIPIPDMETAQRALIHKFAEYILYLKQQPTVNSRDLKYTRDRVMVGYFNRIIDGMVYESYLPDELHKGSKHFFQPLLDEQLPQLEEIQGDKMSACRDIFERLYEKTHPVAVDLFFMSSVKPIRIIESRT